MLDALALGCLVDPPAFSGDAWRGRRARCRCCTLRAGVRNEQRVVSKGWRVVWGGG